MENQFLIIPRSEFEEWKAESRHQNQRILDALREGKSNYSGNTYLTVKEFMTQVKIARSKFDELVAEGRVKTLRPNGGRKIYIPVTEVARYFEGE
ncbi:MAG: helix-turn-helix domain-containing protein [Cytophagia bacterium]|nr:helix-turn-helix domain-containing protein [Cytophagia bacterium]